MKRIICAAFACSFIALIATPGWAQCGCGPSYRIVHKTVYDQEQVTAYRWQYETVFREKQVTVQRPVWDEELRERRYRVAKPVTETAEREERYKVRKPVWETEYREEAFDRTTYVNETQTREERYLVQRPVWEDHVREQSYTVQRPVTETVMQDQQCTTYEPQVSCHTQYVDQGQCVNNLVYQQGATRNRLAWLPGGYYTDPSTGLLSYHRGGLHWTPLQLPGSYQMQQQYVPNIVAQQVSVTQMVAKVSTTQVPVQVTRMENQVMKVQIPEKVCRMETSEEVRQIPVTVQRPVVERIVNRVPIQVCKWVEEEMVRKVPVTTQRIEYEERVEPVRVKTLRYETEIRSVQEPHTVGKWVPYLSTRLTPRTVTMRIPLDQFGNEITAPVTTSYRASEIPSTIPSTSSIISPPISTLKKVTPLGPKPPPDYKAQRSGTSGSSSTQKGGAKDSDPVPQPKLAPKDLDLNSPGTESSKKNESTKSGASTSYRKSRSA